MLEIEFSNYYIHVKPVMCLNSAYNTVLGLTSEHNIQLSGIVLLNIKKYRDMKAERRQGRKEVQRGNKTFHTCKDAQRKPQLLLDPHYIALQ